MHHYARSTFNYNIFILYCLFLIFLALAVVLAINKFSSNVSEITNKDNNAIVNKFKNYNPIYYT